jgi:hypothetical protein
MGVFREISNWIDETGAYNDGYEAGEAMLEEAEGNDRHFELLEHWQEGFDDAVAEYDDDSWF